MSDDDDTGPDLSRGIPVADLPDGALVGGTVDGDSVVLVNHGGRRCAFSGHCTHLDAPLADGLVVDGTLRCPWHHARFSLETGEAVGAPAFEPLERYDVVERDGRIVVTGKLAAASPPRPSPDDVPQRIVIVGGGGAGHACAEMLARHGFGDRVTIVSDDADRPYDRTFCSKQFLSGEKSRDDSFLPLPDTTTSMIGRRATAIDVAGRTMALDDGTTLPWDALVLATGAEPIRPDLPGFDRPDVHLLRTLKDADALLAAAQPGKRAVIVGASFIGLEAAASLTQRDVSIDVVGPEAVPLAKVLGPEVGAMIRQVHEEQGVRFHLGRKATSWDGHALVLDNGHAIEADFVVVGAGVKPRVELARAAGLAVADDGDGVIVDDALKTSIDGVYAIGDIARYPDRDAGHPIRVEHWVHAQRQGQFVARHLMGLADRYEDLPFFWSAHFDTGLVVSGHVDQIAEAKVDGSIADREFTIVQKGTEDDRAFVACNRDLEALETEAEWEDRRLR